jgi:hypothetical protein
MSRKCKIENHLHRNIIVKQLTTEDEYSDIVRDFPDLTWDDLNYYKQKKLPDVLSKSNDLKTEVEEIRGTPILAEVRALKTRTLVIQEDAGWLQVLELPSYYFPPELREGLK